MSYKEIYEQAGLENAFLEHLEVQILKTSPLSANHGGGKDSGYITGWKLLSWQS